MALTSKRPPATRLPTTVNANHSDANISTSSTDPNHLAKYYYNWVHSHVLSRQTGALGLFPRSTSAHVTDNVYTAVSLWALSKVCVVGSVYYIVSTLLLIVFRL